MGHDVTVAIDRVRGRTTSEEPGAPRFQALGLLDDGGLKLSVKSSPWQVWQDMRRLRSRRVDVVHSHFSHDHLIARWGRPKHAALVRSIHAPRSIRWSLPYADGYTVPSEGDARRLLGRRVTVMPPFVAPEFQPAPSKVALRRELGVDGAPLVGMVSTFQPSRRHDVGVAAFAELSKRVPGAWLVLVGDGEMQAATAADVKARGLSEKVIFAGYQSGDAFVRWLQALDVVWILGLGNDFSGRAAAQARACDVRVVAVDVGSLALNADAIVSLEPAEIAAATLEAGRSVKPVRTNEQIAGEVMRLYAPRPLLT
jgi:glycosyltransferase involved in cell wall biosynthesis